jgi:hypothetical protein
MMGEALAARLDPEFEMLQAPGTPVIIVRGQPQLGFSPAHIARALGAVQPGG